MPLLVKGWRRVVCQIGHGDFEDYDGYGDGDGNNEGDDDDEGYDDDVDDVGV